jgi:hypothetical protein
MKRLLLLAAFALPLSASAQTENRHVLEGDKIIGDYHKPNVMVVITRQNLSADYQVQLRESFLPQIVESVERGPF